MIDKSVIGRETRSAVMTIERGRLRLFSRLLGFAPDGPYCDLDVARAAGHPDLPVPPSFLASFETETGEVYQTLDAIGVDLGTILNGEQGFTYHRPIHAGDDVVFTTRIADVYDRRGGQLEFVVRETTVTRGDEVVAELRNVLVSVHRDEVA